MIATAYLAKGLEFDQVIVPFCDEGNYNVEIDRHLLYVACTRAMHKLSLTHTAEPSPFLNAALEQSLVIQQIPDAAASRRRYAEMASICRKAAVEGGPAWGAYAPMIVGDSGHE